MFPIIPATQTSFSANSNYSLKLYPRFHFKMKPVLSASFFFSSDEYIQIMNTVDGFHLCMNSFWTWPSNFLSSYRKLNTNNKSVYTTIYSLVFGPRSSNVSVFVCVSHLLQWYKSFKLLQDICRTSAGLLKDFWRTLDFRLYHHFI